MKYVRYTVDGPSVRSIAEQGKSVRMYILIYASILVVTARVSSRLIERGRNEFSDGGAS